MTAPGNSSKSSIALSRGDSAIKVFRLGTGMSTATMAGISGLSVDRIEAIEAGGQGTDDELWKMARALNIPFEMLGL